jgi:hypothetical protein
MMDLQKLIAKMDQLSEAEDPASVIAKYTEMGKSPTAQMPAFIDPKDGKVKYIDNANASMGQQPQVKVMPSDWVKRYAPDLAAALAAQGGNKAAYGAQEKGGLFGIKGLGNFDQGTKVNTQQAGADATSATFIKDMVAKITPLLDKVEKKAGVVNYSLGGTGTGGPGIKLPGATEGLNFKSGIARVLAESLGYELNEAEADPDMAELEKMFAQVADIEDPTIKSLQDRYQKILATKKEADAPGQTATPTPGGPSSQDLTGAAGAAGEEVGKKLQRYKELLAKASGKTAPTQTATPKPTAAAGANPLAADPITANAKPKTEARLSEAEKYAALRDRLLMIEARDDVQDQETDEGIADLARGAWNVGKNFAGGLGGKMAQGTTKTAAELATSQAATNAARVAAGKKALSAAQLAQQAKVGIGANNAATGAAKFANRAGTAIAKNPVKTAIAATGVGAAAGYGLSGGAEKKPEDNKPVVPPKPGVLPPKVPEVPGQTATPVPGGLTPEEMKELDTLAQSFGDSEDEEIAGLNKQYGDVKNAIMNAKK